MAMEKRNGPYELTPPGEISSRLIKLQGKMKEKNLELVLLLQNVDVFYFTGTVQKGYLFIPQDGEAVFFVQKDYARAAAESPLKCLKVEALDSLQNLLADHGLEGERVGMELDVVPVSLFDKIKSLFPKWKISSISTEIKGIRSIKSDFEIRQMKRSGEIITQVFSGAKNRLREGMSELELDGILNSMGRASGHQGFLRMRGLNQEMMNLHVLSGANASVASFCDSPLSGHGLTPAIGQGSSSARIERDQPVVIDYGGGYNGYVTDETRTFVIGRLKGLLEKACRVSLDILGEIESFARAGELPSRIYEKAQEMARKEGLAAHFMGYGDGKVFFAGHGLGLEINEWPIISEGNVKPLQPGMVFAFEPKFVFPNEGAVGTELDYIVREDGLERVTQFPKAIIYL